jgi:ribonuclease HI
MILLLNKTLGLVLQGLNLARVKGYRAMEVFIDSEVVVKMLNGGKTKSVLGW